MFIESAEEVAADLEKAGAIPKSAPAPRGVSPVGFPDGGFGWINCIGVFQEYYQESLLLGYSSSTISWIPSLQIFMMFLGGPVFGKLFDNYSPRWLLLGGTFFYIFGLMMTSLSTKHYQFILAQGICSALGASDVFYAAISSVGYPWTLRAVALVMLGMLVVANLTVKFRLMPQPRKLDAMSFVRPLKERAFSLLCLASFLFFFGTFLPGKYIILQARIHGMSASLSIYLIAILNAASIFGRILPGIIADRVGRFNVTVITTAFSAIIVLNL
ncbi:hypothetical protein MBM_07461 [Drepanopeziza brunnea f. sp. 'multigermtubi' MB_m1]|uniref:Major facilitator superfamily (MFS) profile domain-containing protein n=1 Tax=Marssonina brunnea f. sp. multigermtubi (strain MB_m1) TaxID=1072389 RepID=K1WMZ5_MARBU|nr:uncharacterized protein MBM_07461 [Drepanopeziza brunnea f. sp. 'multigermtubi' MB_m1]EKD14231.1 hypothetical protein MBM_07461 [Drepanopeziza brunnea f. sp. 'multigermtubi' MB_m1]